MAMKVDVSWVRGNDALLKVMLADGDGSAIDLDALDEWRVRVKKAEGVGRPCPNVRDTIYTENMKGDEQGVVYIRVDKTTPCGTYAIEFTGSKNGVAIRSMESPVFGIVETNGKANVNFGVLEGERSADINIKMQLVNFAMTRGENAYEIWKKQPGNEDKTLADFIYFLGHGESAYEIAVRYGYTGTEAEYNMLYFDAVDVANTAGQNAQQAADTANQMAAQAQDAAELVEQRIDTIDDQMAHLCYHDVAGETVGPAAFNPQSDTVWNKPQVLSDEQKQQARRNIGAAGLADIAGSPIVNHGTSDTGTSSTPYSIAPNTLHVWGEVSALYLSLTPGEVGYVQEYMIQFTSGSTATTLSLPNTLKWLNGVTPSDIEASKTYQVSILNGVGVIGGAE